MNLQVLLAGGNVTNSAYPKQAHQLQIDYGVGGNTYATI